jgi:NADH-quinone oxidoreductase subunit H
MKLALFFMAEYCNMVVAAAVVTVLFFGGYQIPWLPREVLVQHAGILLPLKLGLVALVCGWIALLYFRRVQREKNRFRDARDREPGLLGTLFACLAVLALFAFTLRPWTVSTAGASLFATLVQIGAFIGKVVFFSWLFIWVRWTLPRFRYDQLMALGWKVMLPLGLANLVVTALVVALV